MSLVTCPDCQAQISTIAPACPRCGRPLATQRPIEVATKSPAARLGTLALATVLIVVVVVLCVVAGLYVLRAALFG
jgi:hypothetical protein